ncbi:uncharacterized protein LOC110888547 [Helianthus annuus]|uniref:uncharacterized protein LOC110888547 n=1 Tax=Helianthus annuus TaxID=4232 RepID=UPI000B8F2139|nr:uncharacterized protein LOC110888547 [Helianthus annuus]
MNSFSHLSQFLATQLLFIFRMETPVTTAVSTVVTAVMTSAVAVTTGLQKMFFYLTTLNLARFLTEPKPHVDEGEMDAQTVSAIHAWNHLDFLCRNFILNGLVDTMYNVYFKAKTAKELWESLDRKYKTEDAGTKKFVVAKFLDFKMIDSKTVMSQVQELRVILHDIHAEGMMLSETFQVAAMIEKLSPSWVDFKNYLKHKRKEMTIEDLVGKNKDSGKGGKKGHGKRSNLGPKGGVGKKKFQGTCNNCQKQGHKASECKLPKKENDRQVNMVHEVDKLVTMVTDLSILVTEVNLVGQNNKDWFVMCVPTIAFSTPSRR